MEPGLFFLANDWVYELCVAFLNSVRFHEPALPICFIPFGDSCERIADLASEYGFSVFDDESILDRCDAISEKFHGTIYGHYRKLAAWQGPFDRFAYIDVDTVLLSSLEVPFSLLDDYDILTASSDIPNIRKFVWKESIDFAEPQIDSGYAANAGIFFSNRGVLPIDHVEASVDAGLKLAPHMELAYVDQPFLNYLIVTSGCRYSSLSRICREQNREDIPLAVSSGHYEADRVKALHPILAIHWASVWRHGEHEKSPVWQSFRHLRDGERELSAG